MNENCDLNQLGNELLRELYSLSEQYESSDLARDILRAKAKKVPDTPVGETDSFDTSVPSSNMVLFSSIMSELAMEGFVASGNRYMTLPIQLMSESPEKEYLLALAALRNGKNETQRLESLRHISSALASSPGDPRFRALAAILQQA